MKKSQTRRILLLLGCAVLLVCLSVGATLAYLTSQTDVVTNTFTVGNVQITLDEAKVDVYGKVLTGEDAGRGTSNTYKLIPGHEYTKDPTIHVAAGSEKCYLFVKVENGIAEIEAATTIADQMTANGWTALTGVDGVFYYINKGDSANTNGFVVDALTSAQDIDVFGKFYVSSEALIEPAIEADRDPDALYINDFDGAEITVQAYAVQADGFTSAEAAWAAAPCTWGE